MVDNNNPNENWIDNKWRPMVGWVYMATCIFDFIIAPILWPIMLAVARLPITAWVPLTLQNAGLYHVAMGGIVGVTSLSRTREKLFNTGQDSGQSPTANN